jgi:hypothetical protein
MRVGWRVSVVGGAVLYGVDGPGIESRQGQGIFLFSKKPRRALGLTQTLIVWYRRTFMGRKSVGA